MAEEEYQPLSVEVTNPTSTTGLALEATLQNVLTELQSIDAKDFATQTTLAAVQTLLTSLDGKDFATQTTLASLDAKDFATETTLAAVSALLTSLDSKDFATQTTLAALNGKDFSTEATLEAARVLLASIDAKDFATETTLAAVLAELQAGFTVSNFPSEYPLPASQSGGEVAQEDTLALINAKDFATQTTLAAVLTELGQKLEAGQSVDVGNLPSEYPLPASQTSGEIAQEATVSSISSRFARILKFEPAVGEEIRREETTSFDYHGAATDGTATSTASWDVVRFTKTAGLITRVQFASGIAWDDRATGPPWS